METRTYSSWSVAPCLLLSIGIHAGAALAIGGLGWSGPGARSAVEFAPPTPPEVRPGIERSDAMSISWIGFEDPTPHSATPAESDQPELTMNSGAPATMPADLVPPPPPPPPPAPGAGAPGGGGGGPPSPSAMTPSEVAEAKQTLEMAWRELGVQTERGARSLEAVGKELRRSARDAAEAVRALMSALATPADEPTETLAETPPEPTPTPSPAAPPPSPGEPGQSSDRESTASSIARVEIEARKLGNPAAGAGLDIKTVRPRFTHYTRLTVQPKDPLIRVEFDRTGVVVGATVVESSGHRDVDRPILDAIYRWTATGEALDSLKPGSDPATVALEFRIVL